MRARIPLLALALILAPALAHAGGKNTADVRIRVIHAQSGGKHFDPKLKAKGSPTNFAAVQDFERRLEPHYGKFYRYLDGNRDAFESLQWKTQIKVEQTAERIHRKDPDAARQYLTTWSIRQQATVDLLVREWSVRLEDVANGVIRNGR